MEIIHAFPCLLSLYKNQQSEEIMLYQTKLELYSHRIVLSFSKCNYDLQTSIEKHSFEISYKLSLKWKCYKDKLSMLQFPQFFIQAESEDLQVLKSYLDCKTTCFGIKELYYNVELLFVQEYTKICTIVSRLDGKCYQCRCFKKEDVEKYQIYEQLMVLRNLANSKNISKAIEYFESSNSYYVIFEELRVLDITDLCHEDIQSIMFVIFLISQDILGSIKTLINNHIYHSKIQLSNFWIDKQMICKLGGLEYARFSTEQTEEKNSEMLAQVGQIMLQLYQSNYPYQEHLCIPDYGNELLVGLLDPNMELQFSVEQALSHDYFAYFDYNSSPMQQQQIVPKLKTYITEQSITSSPIIGSTL